MNFKKLNSRKYWSQRGKPPKQFLEQGEHYPKKNPGKAQEKPTLADWVYKELTESINKKKIPYEKAMEKILQQYPLLEDKKNKFDTDEELEPSRNNRNNDMGVIMQNLQGKMGNL